MVLAIDNSIRIVDKIFATNKVVLIDFIEFLG